MTPTLTGTITEAQFWYILRLKRNISLREQFMKNEELLEVVKAEFGDITGISTERATEIINRLRSQSDFVTRRVCTQSGFPITLIHPGALIKRKQVRAETAETEEEDQRWKKALEKLKKETSSEVDG